jgi:Uma2 family endonuclease
MTTTKRELLTADDLLRLHSQGVRGELILGVLAETVASGGEHGEIAISLAASLLSFVKQHGLGRVFGTDTGVLLEREPDLVREPDVAYLSAEKLPLDVRIRGYYHVVPDLVVEIASPNDTIRALNDKARMWISYGVALVWVVDPDTKTVAVHQPGASTFVLSEEDTLDGGEALPGFTLPVREIFE